ncbi:MAG: PLP-dependent aminotransferase family protein [Clostridiales bacterium]|nr:PLP-dependent aminotransferase family protein [Clostridiales bacterium]
MIFSTLKINNNKPIYIQIYEHIMSSLKKGVLKKDDKLPSTREASKILNISRNSVIVAYEELESRGVIKTLRGKGTFIAIDNKDCKDNKVKLNINWKDKFNEYSKILRKEDIVKSEPIYKKGMISFKSISPDDKLFNVDEFKKALWEAWSMEERNLLNYGYAKGYRNLIEYFMDYMKSKGVYTFNKDILITNGFTEAFDIILSSITVKGDIIFTEKPTHNTAIKIMKAHGIKIVQIPMDKDGIIISELEKELEKNIPKAAYLIPSYNNPTGIVTKVERRKEILLLFAKYKVPVIEDGFSEELFYSSSPIQPMAALEGDGNGVLYLGSLSKVLFPGLRIGWIFADKKIIDILESVKRGRNIHVSFLDQSAFYNYLKNGAFERYIKNIRKYYKDKYNIVVKNIKKYLKCEYITGEGGLHVFVKLKDNIDTRKLLYMCYEKGVLFMPGDIFYADSKYYEGKNKICNSFRIGFGRVNDEDIEKGIKIISECIEQLKKEDNDKNE